MSQDLGVLSSSVLRRGCLEGTDPYNSSKASPSFGFSESRSKDTHQRSHTLHPLRRQWKIRGKLSEVTSPPLPILQRGGTCECCSWKGKSNVQRLRIAAPLHYDEVFRKFSSSVVQIILQGFFCEGILYWLLFPKNNYDKWFSVTNFVLWLPIPKRWLALGLEQTAETVSVLQKSLSWCITQNLLVMLIFPVSSWN